jgi:hypothetical protein
VQLLAEARDDADEHAIGREVIGPGVIGREVIGRGVIA